MWGAGPGGQEGYLERSWLEPRLSIGEMLAECRCAACLLGDTDRDPALGLVRDLERLFFFFSCGLLEGKRVRQRRSAGRGVWALPTARHGHRTFRVLPPSPKLHTLYLTRN